MESGKITVVCITVPAFDTLIAQGEQVQKQKQLFDGLNKLLGIIPTCARISQTTALIDIDAGYSEFLNFLEYARINKIPVFTAELSESPVTLSQECSIGLKFLSEKGHSVRILKERG